MADELYSFFRCSIVRAPSTNQAAASVRFRVSEPNFTCGLLDCRFSFWKLHLHNDPFRFFKLAFYFLQKRKRRAPQRKQVKREIDR
jgi:hypothetical protein